MGVFIETSKRCAQSGSTPLLHLAMISLSTKKKPVENQRAYDHLALKQLALQQRVDRPLAIKQRDFLIDEARGLHHT